MERRVNCTCDSEHSEKMWADLQGLFHLEFLDFHRALNEELCCFFLTGLAHVVVAGLLSQLKNSHHPCLYGITRHEIP